MTQTRIVPIVLLISFVAILFLRITPLPNQYATFSTTLKSPYNTQARRQVPVFSDLEHFCHTDPGVSIYSTSLLKKANRDSCFGQCKNSTNISIRDAAVEAPNILSLCLLNPFHGFYDCLWPLVHYLSSCRPDHPPVIINTTSIPERRRTRWVVLARETFLKYSGVAGDTVELGSLHEGECVCFRSVIKFHKKAFWRPIRFQYRQDFGNHKVLAPHPTVLKRNALRIFRRSIQTRYTGEERPSENVSRILVYGRQDAHRRRWLNIDDFVTRLLARLPPGFDVSGTDRVPETFGQQVLKHNQVDILIAPHGAAMVNTLAMREGSAIVEIASRHCIDLRLSENTTNLDVAMDPTDPNSWVPWHSQSLGLYHLVAPCYLSTKRTGNDDFVTDNESLVNLTLLATAFLRKLG